MDTRIKEVLKEKSSEGRISCAMARQIAETYKVSYGEVGRAADELRIKITDCELGCF
ncbi:MAG: hypothetical protein HY805_10125 [Nitrospirae bacterium]|nr:hypothetical protein [Nitrospirota bacterium]